MVKEHDSTVDWVTITTDTTKGKREIRLYADLQLFKSGEKVSSWRMLQYVGRRVHYADGSGGMAYGEHTHKCQSILQVWGDAANKEVRNLAGLGGKPTRVDYAVTALMSSPQPPVVEYLYDLQQRLGQKYSLVVPVSAAGGTLYVGSRTSDKYGRLYDKGAQIGRKEIPERSLWRWEVEYKRRCALQALELVTGEAMDGVGRAQTIRANVLGFFGEHHVWIPKEIQEDRSSLVRYSVRVMDDSKTLAWLSDQVKPAIGRLLHKHKWADLCEVLGVNEAGEALAATVSPYEQIYMFDD